MPLEDEINAHLRRLSGEIRKIRRDFEEMRGGKRKDSQERAHADDRLRGRGQDATRPPLGKNRTRE